MVGRILRVNAGLHGVPSARYFLLGQGQFFACRHTQLPLDEINAGTNPNSANLTIDATGYLTPYELTPPSPTSIHLDATAVTPIFEQANPVSSDPNGPYRPGDNTITWKPSNSSDDDLRDDPGLVSDPPEQAFFIRPLLSVSAGQMAERNSTVNVKVFINGEAPSYPVTVNYSLSGTASGSDYTAPAPASGAVTFNDTTPQTISFDLTSASAGETVILTLTSASNAAIGVSKRHTVTVFSENVAPQGGVAFDQGGTELAFAFAGANGGQVNITANVTDGNAGQTLTYDWSGSDNALVPPGGSTNTFTTPALSSGNYLVDVVVRDNGSPRLSTRITRILSVQSGAVVALSTTTDSDGDGENDDVEGYADADGDGIPAYLDPNEDSTYNPANPPAGANLIPDQTEDLDQIQLLETDPGLSLARGRTAEAASRFGTLVTDSEIADFGANDGTAPRGANDSFEHATGIYDFEIRGLVPGSSARIVIPLQSAIPRDAVYRKFDPETGWRDFVVDENNSIASALGAGGACPEPGSSLYSNGLNYLDNCIQLIIEDGGPNDTDGSVNGVVADPSTTGFTLEDPEGFEEVEEGSGGRMAPMLLAVLLMLAGVAIRRRQRGVRID